MRTRNIKRLMIGEILSSLFVISALSGQSARKQPCRPPSAQMLQRSQQYLENIPCVPVATACNKGGYILGCSSVKMGLVWECMALPFTGKTVPGVEMLPTGPHVGACKQFCGPDFAKGGGLCKEVKGVVDR